MRDSDVPRKGPRQDELSSHAREELCGLLPAPAAAEALLDDHKPCPTTVRQRDSSHCTSSSHSSASQDLCPAPISHCGSTDGGHASTMGHCVAEGIPVTELPDGTTVTITATTITMPPRPVATGYVAAQLTSGTSRRTSPEGIGVFGIHYPDLPDPEGYWQQQHFIMFWWLLASVLCLMLFTALDMGTGVFIMSEFAAVLGITAASIYTCKGCSGGVDLAAHTRAVHVLGMIAVVLNMFTLVMVDSLLLQYAMECPVAKDMMDPNDSCESAWGWAVFLSLVLLGHAALSFTVAQRAHEVQMMLDPLSGGIGFD